MAIRGVSLLDMDFSKEFPFEFAVQSSPSSSSTYRTRKHKVAGLDLVPIHSSPDRDQRIAVAQVCVWDEVLV